jgi:hypothetical protein
MKFGIAFLGGGPAGTGPLIWAAQSGRLDAVLDRGVAIVEREDAMGGSLDRYIINADSMGTSFLECIDAGPAQAHFAEVRTAEVTRRLELQRMHYPPLRLIAAFERRLHGALEAIVRAHPKGAYYPRTTVSAVHLEEDGGARVRFADGGGIAARTLVFGMGGRQDPEAMLAMEIRPGLRVADMPQDKIMPSGRLLTTDGVAEAAERLARAKTPRAIVIGGSHSAFSSAWVLLNRLQAMPDFPERGITLMHRRPARVWYGSEQDARADDYYYTARDVCPLTGRVHRMGGLRNDGRDLWRRLSGRPGTLPEPRAQLLWLGDHAVATARVRQLLDEATLIVPALGYRFNTVPIFDPAGRRLPLMAERGQSAVGPDSRLLLADGRALPNIFGAGLGSGYRPWGEMAGEPSFDGHQNSLWLFQNGLGRQILEGIEACLGEPKRPGRNEVRAETRADTRADTMSDVASEAPAPLS